MYLETQDFTETEDSFKSCLLKNERELIEQRVFLVKAHEKNIYSLPNDLILAEIHRDNDGRYNFTKLDFLSHCLLKLVFPKNVPKLFFADFSNQRCPYFILERVELDIGHICYNVSRQIVHKRNGRDFRFIKRFFNVAKDIDIDVEAKEHVRKVKQLQELRSNDINEYGITIDHSYVNITFPHGSEFVSLEVHKCNADYLFDIEKFTEYAKSIPSQKTKREAMIILDRIKEIGLLKGGSLLSKIPTNI